MPLHLYLNVKLALLLQLASLSLMDEDVGEEHRANRRANSEEDDVASGVYIYIYVMYVYVNV